MTHTGIRETLSMHLEHVYNDSFWVKTSIKINCVQYFEVVQILPLTGNKYVSHGSTEIKCC